MGGGRVGALTAVPDTPLATDQEERCALPPRPGVQPLRESVATGVPQETGRAVRMLTQIFIVLTWNTKLQMIFMYTMQEVDNESK